MSAFQSLDELVEAGQAQLPTGPQSTLPSTSRRSRRAPRTVKKHTRFTATPVFASPVNQNGPEPDPEYTALAIAAEAQVIVAAEVRTPESDATTRSAGAAETGAGKQELEMPVNHTEVMVPQQFPAEMQQLLAQIGVNLRERQLGRKYVLDDFLRGRLVSLLAMGLTLRQAASALGLSHAAIWKALRKDAELSEQVNTARFQAQIEPLLVILRESKRSWRAATWLINYLNKSLAKSEQAADERGRCDNEETVEYYRQQAELSAAREIEQIKAGRRVRAELERR